jgi:hypothetical protein
MDASVSANVLKNAIPLLRAGGESFIAGIAALLVSKVAKETLYLPTRIITLVNSDSKSPPKSSAQVSRIFQLI